MSTATTTYNSVAKILHWVIALLILSALAIGWTMTDDAIPNGPMKGLLFQTHKSFGILVLGLSLLRMLRRLMNPPPALPDSMPRWEKIAAKATHCAFYVLMLALPLTGWALNSTSIHHIVLFGVVPFPNLPVLPDLPNKKEIGEVLEGTHGAMASILAALLVLHVGGALKHHFIDRDSVLLRMLPRCKCCGGDKGGSCG